MLEFLRKSEGPLEELREKKLLLVYPKISELLETRMRLRSLPS